MMVNLGRSFSMLSDILKGAFLNSQGYSFCILKQIPATRVMAIRFTIEPIAPKYSTGKSIKTIIRLIK
jgi:hypothetical protein